jgi:hypothetical protein
MSAGGCLGRGCGFFKACYGHGLAVVSVVEGVGFGGGVVLPACVGFTV